MKTLKYNYIKEEIVRNYMNAACILAIYTCMHTFLLVHECVWTCMHAHVTSIKCFLILQMTTKKQQIVHRRESGNLGILFFQRNAKRG